jgi:NAD(P)H-hydrate epimerase
VGIVAGRKGYGGAAIMSAMGALRAGCGGVRILSPECNRAAIHAAVPEAVVLERGADGAVGEVIDTAALLIGPGMGLDEEAADLLQTILDRFGGPIVLDADALTLLSRGEVSLAKEVAARSILTPHPGELARLLGASVAEVLDDRFASIRALAERYDCAVLAKGAPSLVTAGGGPVLIGSAGHSGVATGGMGDTLGGVVAALLAGSRTPWEAGAVGLHLAGRAAEIAGRGRGLLPRDVAETIPAAVAQLEAAEASSGNPPFRLELPLPR